MDKYWPFARKLVIPARRRFPRFADEIDSAAGMALAEAARSYDPAFGVKFATFLAYRVLGAIKEVFGNARKSAPIPFSVVYPSSLTYMQSNMERGDIEPWEGRPDARFVFVSRPRPVGEALESREFLDHFLSRIPKRHAKVIKLLYIDELTQSEVGARIGLAQSGVSRLAGEGIEMLNFLMQAEPGRPGGTPPSGTPAPRGARA